MTTLIEAAKQALEAMEKTTYTFLDTEGSHGLQEQETIEQVYKAITALRAALEEQPAEQQEPVAWRDLCRRLYIELYWCDRQMMETLDADGEPMWTQGKTVRDALADAKAALDTSPPAKPWVNPSLKEYEDIMLANITPRTNDERDGIMGALNDMVVLLQKRNT